MYKYVGDHFRASLLRRRNSNEIISTSGSLDYSYTLKYLIVCAVTIQLCCVMLELDRVCLFI